MIDLPPFAPACAGEVLDGRYRLDEVVGQGAMGAVWRASDETLGRTVAIKLFPPGVTGATDAVRRESEKRLLASVNHPSLVTLFDANLDSEQRPYLVMEYIDGGTLAARIAEGPVDVLDAASLAAELGEALHVMHEADIVHRDIKPANVLLRPPLTAEHTFRAVLADFGIAHLVDAARVTTPGTAIGTAAYISPEQVRGEVPTPASDIYSLGLVLFEALTGARAFPQQSPIEAVAARLSSMPVVPGTWGYGWRSLLTSMTSLDPQARPTALEVAIRGRALDSDDSEPGTTGAMTEHAAATARSATAEREPLSATMVLPASGGAPTQVIPDGADRARTPAVAAPSDASPRATAAKGHRGRRIGVIVGAAVVLAIGVVWALTAWGGLTADPTPAPAPQIPQVEEPLGTHLRDLMEQVSP